MRGPPPILRRVKYLLLSLSDPVIQVVVLGRLPSVLVLSQGSPDRGATMRKAVGRRRKTNILVVGS